MGGDWAYLPGDLLIDIAKRFNTVEDMAVFSSVCSSWNAVSGIVKAKLAPAVPWLMLPDNIENSPSCKWTIRNPSTNRCYNMVLPETCGRCCWGCADGWIFTVDLNMDIELFNPLTKVRISLPPADKFPMLEEIMDFDDLDHREWFRMSCILCVSVIQIPPNNDLRVFVMYDKFCLAFARPGDFKWNALECCDEIIPGTGKLCYIENMAGYNGEILILYENGKLSSLGKLDGFVADEFAEPVLITKDEVDCIAEVYVCGEVGGAVSRFTIQGDDDPPPKRLYLLESFGDLLVVVEYMKGRWGNNDPSEELVMWRFEVFKLDSKEKKWVELKNLGDVALFVGDRSNTMAVRASSADNCKPNCIYFIFDKVSPVNFKEYALGVFDLSSGVMEDIYVGDGALYDDLCSPFWLMPKCAMQ